MLDVLKEKQMGKENSNKPIRILSIQGGGIRGLIPAIVLAEIEKKAVKPIHECFDLIAGTSTGGIIALGLTKPNPMRPADLATLYEDQGREIFPKSVWRNLRKYVDEKYPSKGLVNVLKQVFGNDKLSSVLTNVIITSYDIEHRRPFFFTSNDVINKGHPDFLLRDVAHATSAAPTYFEPCKISLGNSNNYLALIDGGVFANNPAMCAYIEAKKIFPSATDFIIVSLGTGQLTRPIPYDEAKDWGLMDWAVPILSVVFDGVNDTVNYQLKKLLPGVQGLHHTSFLSRSN